MSDKFIVRSRFKNYEVAFSEDFIQSISSCVKDNDFLFIDKRVHELYMDRINGLFKQDNIIIIEANEQSKTLENSYKLITRLVENNIRRDNRLFAIGGGVMEDLTGFISSIIFRGIEWLFIPTTLLAQADSCIGSKTSINMDEYKNLLGTFYPPSHVFIDMNFLATLAEEELKSGIGEILHFYLIAGKDKLASEMMSNYEKLLKEPVMLKEYILQSLKIKKSVIEKDEFDKGIRNIFNYGHTFGHAIETVTSYAINHGQAVSMGMDIANHISLSMGHITKNKFEYMHSILEKNIPAFSLTEENLEAYFRALSKDKKNIGKNVGCILTKGPGSMMRVQIPMAKNLKNFIRSYFNISEE